MTLFIMRLIINNYNSKRALSTYARIQTNYEDHNSYNSYTRKFTTTINKCKQTS